MNRLIRFNRISIRKYSEIPYEAKPKNKYNSITSAYNFKPVPNTGIVFNPPSSSPGFKQTPRAFLPANDPRRELPIHKTYTDEEMSNMPIIHGTTRKYDVDEKTAQEIIKLRTNDPKTWTVSMICKKFNVNALFVINLTKDYKPKPQLRTLSNEQQEQLKRVKMWLRNEY